MQGRMKARSSPRRGEKALGSLGSPRKGACQSGRPGRTAAGSRCTVTGDTEASAGKGTGRPCGRGQGWRRLGSPGQRPCRAGVWLTVTTLGTPARLLCRPRHLSGAVNGLGTVGPHDGSCERIQQRFLLGFTFLLSHELLKCSGQWFLRTWGDSARPSPAEALTPVPPPGTVFAHKLFEEVTRLPAAVRDGPNPV